MAKGDAVTVRRSFAPAVLTAALALALPGMAHAATVTVSTGAPAKAEKQFEAVQATVNDFFPHRVSIHVGDSLRFVTDEFHTVDLPPKGGKLEQLLTPASQKASGVTDAAGAAFWFNGQPLLQLNPAMLPGIWGQRATYSGAARVLSGVPPLPTVKPLTVKFAKKGRFTFLCDVHPGMKGVVDVLPRRASLPSRRVRNRALATQISRALKIGKRLPRPAPSQGVVDVGAPGRNGVERLAMFPATTTVAAGQPVTFRMTRPSREAHTVTFGPGPADNPSTYVGALSASFRNLTAPLDARAAYPSEQPGAAAPALTPTLHGNGFWNSGLLDADSRTPLPDSASVTFGAPGTYEYFCLIHPQMVGVVKVT
jgi:plastocyanin